MKKLPRSTSLVAVALAAGVTIGTTGLASASSSHATKTHHVAKTKTAHVGHRDVDGPRPQGADPVDPGHGPNETLLTGSQLLSADAAATAAVPGATIVRAETNSSGASTYEVHMKKADGTRVTVELDSTFQVVAIINGNGPGAPNQGAPDPRHGDHRHGDHDGPGAGVPPTGATGSTGTTGATGATGATGLTPA